MGTPADMSSTTRRGARKRVQERLVDRTEVGECPLSQPAAGDRLRIGRVGGRKAVNHRHGCRQRRGERRSGRPTPPLIVKPVRSARGIEHDQAEPVDRVNRAVPARQVGLAAGTLHDRGRAARSTRSILGRPMSMV